MKNRTAAIAGLHIRYDVRTKAYIVNSVLSKTFKSNKALNEFINAQAARYNITSVSIKVWCAKYATTYKQGMKLPKGVMSYSFTPIQGNTISEVSNKLTKLRNKALKIKHKYHPDTGSTPREILDELILDKEQ